MLAEVAEVAKESEVEEEAIVENRVFRKRGLYLFFFLRISLKMWIINKSSVI